MAPTSMLLASFFAGRNLHSYIETRSGGRELRVRLEQGQITLRDGKIREYRLSPGESARLGSNWQNELESKLQGQNVDLLA